jgi:hypothetical protein
VTELAERLQGLLVAVFGANDALVPHRGQRHRLPGSGAAELLTFAVFPDADHPIQAGNPLRLAYGCLETLTSFVLQASA